MLTTKGQNNSNTLEYKHRDLRLIFFFQQKWKKYKFLKEEFMTELLYWLYIAFVFPREYKV